MAGEAQRKVSYWPITSIRGDAAIEHAPVINTRHATRLIRQERLDGGPFIVGEFIAHDSRLRFGNLNHAPGDTINPLRPVETDANTLNLLPLSGA